MKYVIALLLTTTIVSASDDIYCYKDSETCPAGSIILAFDFRTIGLYCDFDRQMVTLPSESFTGGTSSGGGVMCVKRYKPRERTYFKKLKKE